MNTLSVYQLPALNKSSNVIKYLEKHELTRSYSTFLRQAQLSNGFISYMYQTKDKMEFVNDPKYKGKSFWHVTNPFEHSIQKSGDNTIDITEASKLYFGETSLNIVSRAFYKLWEILMLFDIIPVTGSIISAHLAEAPGSFVQSLMFYREKFYRDHSRDEHYTISLEDHDVPSFKKDFKRVYSKVKIYEQDGGDLTTRQSINGFEQFSKKADFITADGGFDWKNENFQEQEAYRLILGEIITAFKIQKPGGSFVLKIFETYTDVSMRLLMILSSAYEDVFIFKPFTSRPSNSERYVICKNYSIVSNTVINKLIDLLEEMNSQHEIAREIADFMVDIEIPHKYMNTINVASSQLNNIQFIAINKIIAFVESRNYYGDQYRKFLSLQQEANDFWIQTFYPVGSSDFRVIKNTITTYLNNTLTTKRNDVTSYEESIETIF